MLITTSEINMKVNGEIVLRVSVYSRSCWKDGRTDGQTEAVSFPPSAFRGLWFCPRCCYRSTKDFSGGVMELTSNEIKTGIEYWLSLKVNDFWL